MTNEIDNDLKALQVTFIGAGNMAHSLISGLLRQGLPAAQICAADPSPEQRSRIATLGVRVTDDNSAACSGADLIVLAVKPQLMGSVLAALTPALQRSQLLVSIAAGIPLAALESWAGADRAIVRCMPNTPALVGAGITALYPNAHVSPAQRDQARQVLATAGQALEVDEEAQLDAVTALSGSGPAYAFYLLEAMIAAGEALGLTSDMAHRLATETLYGAALMARDSEDSPTQLRLNVSSPGGTTERAIEVLDQADTRAQIQLAVVAAATRARELAEQFGQNAASTDHSGTPAQPKENKHD